MLIECTMLERHNAVVSTRFRVPEFEHFGFNVNRIAVKQRRRKANFFPAEICNGRAYRRVANRYSHHKPQRQATVDQWLAKFRALAVLRVDVQWRRIVGQRAKPDIVSLRNGSANGVLKDLTDFEFIEVITGHWDSPVQG